MAESQLVRRTVVLTRRMGGYFRAPDGTCLIIPISLDDEFGRPEVVTVHIEAGDASQQRG